MQLTGIHHLTAITADAPGNHAFYTGTLGMRLVKKTVNQDDVSAYHLFYADAKGSPGTDLTFFDWPAPRERRGTRSIVRTGLRVAGGDTLAWWRERRAAAGNVSGLALVAMVRSGGARCRFDASGMIEHGARGIALATGTHPLNADGVLDDDIEPKVIRLHDTWMQHVPQVLSSYHLALGLAYAGRLAEAERLCVRLQKLSASHVVAIVAERYLGRTDLARNAVKHTSAQT